MGEYLKLVESVLCEMTDVPPAFDPEAKAFGGDHKKAAEYHDDQQRRHYKIASEMFKKAREGSRFIPSTGLYHDRTELTPEGEVLWQKAQEYHDKHVNPHVEASRQHLQAHYGPNYGTDQQDRYEPSGEELRRRGHNQ